jgi:hypothetical protein
MFGLLGGLLGGAMRGGMGHGGGGLLSGLKNHGSGGGGGGSGMPTYAGRASQSESFEPEPQEPSGQTHADRQQEAPPQQPPERAPITQIAPAVEGNESAAMRFQQKISPVSGLLGDTKPSAPPPKAEQDRPPQPESVVNRTNTQSPVAPQPEEKLGFIPHLQQTDGLHNRLFDAVSNRPEIPFQEGLPAKEIDTSDSEWTPPMGLSYRQPTTVGGSVPPPRYRSI